MQRITQILTITPYKRNALFNNGEVRTIDFLPLVEKFSVLKDPAIFSKAKLDDYPTICWENLSHMKELDGTIKPCALDFSPDVLYAMSKASVILTES